MTADDESDAKSPQRSVVERILGIFTDVRAGEGTTALLMLSNTFILLCVYYFIKPLREGWIATSDISGLTKVEVKAYSSFAQSLCLVFMMGWYGRLASRWSRVTLITRSTLFAISNLVVFWLLQPGLIFEDLPLIGIVFYVWVGIMGVFVMAQFWTFCADVYTDERGRRILPLIAVGATLGAVAGSKIISTFVGSGLIGGGTFLILAALPLFVSIGLTISVDRREGGPGGPATRSAPSDPGAASIFSGVRLVLVSRFLLAAAMVTLLTNWVNTNGENLLFRVVQETLAGQAAARGLHDPLATAEFTRDGTTVFYGDFFFWVNTIALVLQAFVASRLLKYGGFATIALMLPVIAILSYSAMVVLPILAVVKAMKISENATDYSINNTARHVLWLPVSSEMKYRGKPVIDTFFVRLGDGLAAGTVLVAVHVLAMSIQTFLLFNLVLTGCWFTLTLMMIREHRKAAGAVTSQAARR